MPYTLSVGKVTVRDAFKAALQIKNLIKASNHVLMMNVKFRQPDYQKTFVTELVDKHNLKVCGFGKKNDNDDKIFIICELVDEDFNSIVEAICISNPNAVHEHVEL